MFQLYCIFLLCHQSLCCNYDAELMPSVPLQAEAGYIDYYWDFT